MKKTSLAVILLLTLLLAVHSLVSAKTTIRYAMWAGTAEFKNYERIIRNFEKDNPDIEVKVEYADWGTYWQKLQTQFAAGTAPDVMRMSGAYLGKFVADGLVANLQPYIDRDSFPIDTDYFDTLNIFRFNGDYYGLPEGGDVVALYYNKDIFNEAGVAYPDETWTWEDLRENAMKLTKTAGNRVINWGVYLSMGEGGNGQSSWYNFMLQNGTQYLNEDKTESKFASKEAKEAIQFMVDLIHKYKAAPSPAQTAALADPFLTGRYAMSYELLPVRIPFLEDVRFDYDVAVMPKGKYRASETNYVGFVMNAKSTEKDAAWRLIKYISSEEGQTILAETRQMLPPLKKVALSGAFSDPSKKPANLRKVLDITSQNVYDLQFTPTWGEWTLVAGKEISQAALGLKTVEQAMDDAHRQVNAILATERK